MKLKGKILSKKEEKEINQKLKNIFKDSPRPSIEEILLSENGGTIRPSRRRGLRDFPEGIAASPITTTTASDNYSYAIGYNATSSSPDITPINPLNGCFNLGIGSTLTLARIEEAVVQYMQQYTNISTIFVSQANYYYIERDFAALDRYGVRGNLNNGMASCLINTSAGQVQLKVDARVQNSYMVCCTEEGTELYLRHQDLRERLRYLEAQYSTIERVGTDAEIQRERNILQDLQAEIYTLEHATQPSYIMPFDDGIHPDLLITSPSHYAQLQNLIEPTYTAEQARQEILNQIQTYQNTVGAFRGVYAGQMQNLVYSGSSMFGQIQQGQSVDYAPDSFPSSIAGQMQVMQDLQSAGITTQQELIQLYNTTQDNQAQMGQSMGLSSDLGTQLLQDQLVYGTSIAQVDSNGLISRVNPMGEDDGE